MSKVITGVVQEIIKKSVSGGRTGYDIVVAGQTYGCGLYPPKCAEGDYIKFDLDDSRGYKNVARNSLKVSANKPPPEAVAEAHASAPQKNAAGGSFDARQDSIMRQSSTNYAIMYMGVLAQAGALTPPAAKGKAQEYMDTMRKKYTQEFYEANTGLVYKDISPNTSTAEDAGDEDAQPDDEAPSDGEWK
jgi:hypothetical protein